VALRSVAAQDAPEAASACVVDGLRVLELGPGLSGAVAALILADNGAEVIKIEPPGGDPLRAHPAFRMWNRGKQLYAADLAAPREREHVAALAAEADVVLSSWRAGVDARFGLDPDSIATRNPRAVVCRISGFGPRGPYAGQPGWDGIVAARAGRMLEFCGLVGGARPAYAAVPVAGWCASQLALHGTLAALLDRERTGRGRRVETSLVQALSIYDLVNWLPGYTMMLRVADVPYLPYTNACTKDGVWLQFAQLSPTQFRAFVRDLGLDEIWSDPRFRHAPVLREPEHMRALRAIVLARVREKTYAEWTRIFDADPDIAVERFRRPVEAMEHPQLRHNGDVVERRDPELGRLRELGPLVRFAATPSRPSDAGPREGGRRAAAWSARPPAGARRPPAGAAPRHVLGGLLVLELATWVATPLAATLLAELGARVIKLEPLGGEPFRQVKHGVPWLKTVQGKESLALDLKRPEAREIVHALARRADVLLHNYRPGVPERLGIDYPTLRRLNPRLVYVYGGSYGSTGPCAHKPAYHPTAGALCGEALAQLGAEGLPPADAALSAEALAGQAHRLELANDTNPDPNAAVATATAVLLALYHRARTGEAQAVETTMLCSNAWALSADYFDHAERAPRECADRELHGLCALYRLYATAEGWVFLAAPTPRAFARLCDALGAPELARDPRFAEAQARRENDALLAERLAAVFATRPAADWEQALGARGVGCVRADQGPFARFAFEEPFMRESGFVTEAQDAELGRYRRFGATVTLSDERPVLRGPCRTGEHTRRVLEELGYAAERIEALARSGVVAGPDLAAPPA
jgi:crotonobetainyl-CoA:carnitine CoA-transferase CaiB-like acyl-CoA transferase